MLIATCAPVRVWFPLVHDTGVDLRQVVLARVSRRNHDVEAVAGSRAMRQVHVAPCPFTSSFCGELTLIVVLAPLAMGLQLPRPDNVVLPALMGLLPVAELLDPGLEAVVDMVTSELHVLAAKAKDCGSAAVFVALLTCAGGPSLGAACGLARCTSLPDSPPLRRQDGDGHHDPPSHARHPVLRSSAAC